LTISIYFVFTIISGVSWSVFYTAIPNFPLIETYIDTGADIDGSKTSAKWTISLFLATAMLNPFLIILIDNKLRRTSLEMFRLRLRLRYCCLCNDGELLAQLLPGDEARPREALDNRQNVYNEPHQDPEAE